MPEKFICKPRSPIIIRISCMALLLCTNILALPRIVLESNSTVTFDSVNISVRVFELTNVGGISLAFTFDSAHIKYGRIMRLNNKMSDALLIGNSKAVYCAWEDISGIDFHDEVLFEVRMRYDGINTALVFDMLRCEIADSAAAVIPVLYSNLQLNTSQSKDERAARKEFALYQNFPNPFNPQSVIRFSVWEQCFLTLDLFSVDGVFITRIAQGEFSPGDYSVAAEFANMQLSSGLYLYSLRNRSHSMNRKLMYLK